MTDAHNAADEAVDAQRLLPGEELEADAATAMTWLRAYSDLLAYKSTLLDTTRAALRTAAPEAAREIRETDLRILEAEAARLQRRFAHWTARVATLKDGSAQAD